jgi:hypothetical protein
MKMLKQSLFVAALALPLSWSAEPAAAQAASAGSAVEAASEAILANAKAIKALEDIKADDEAAFAEQKRITEIPAPPYRRTGEPNIYSSGLSNLASRRPPSMPRATSSRCARAAVEEDRSSWFRHTSTRYFRKVLT